MKWWQVGGAVVVLDLTTKFWFASQLNSGIAFGWLATWSSPQVFLLQLTMLGIVIWLGHQFWSLKPWSWVLLIGGAVANLLDRLVSGGVHDWLTLPGTDLKNNLADWAVALGVLMIVGEFLYADIARRR